MKPFLQQVANLFYREKGSNIENTIFVFPGRRASVFFQQYLSMQAKNAFFAPMCYTLSDFFQALAPEYEKEDRIALLFKLYRCYLSLTQSNESFDSFMSFGEILLKDFNDIDNYLVDAKHIYSNIASLKELEDHSYLTPEQVQALSNYLGYIENTDKSFQAKTGANWAILGELYQQFRQQLLDEKLTYDGLLHRLVVEQETLSLPACDEIVFVGFNALDGATKALFSKLQAMGKADFYWDYQALYLQDKENKATLFAEKNCQLFQSKREMPTVAHTPASIHSIAVPSSIGQTKYVAQLLQQWFKGENQENKAESTAVVLANEQLLIPMLYAMPADTPVNITMGYPLKQTAVRKLIDDYLQLQATYNEDGFYHTWVWAILQHPYIRATYMQEIEKLPKSLSSQLRIRPDQLQAINDLRFLFQPKQASEWLNIANKLLLFLSSKNTQTLDRELLEEAHHILTRIQGLLQQNSDISLQPFTLIQMVRTLISNVNLSFIGEPISGIQMMGMLETRCLDFERLIITSFNEGVYPKKETNNSYIPYSIRHSFGLPTTEHHDAIYAYNFYRLIGKAKQVYLLHDTRNNNQGASSEVSRFVKQLHYLYKLPIKKKNITCSTTMPAIAAQRIQKTPEVLEKIKEFLKNTGLSPSTLNNYIDCPLRFYLNSIEKLYINDTASIELKANQIGTLFHYIMEQLYKPYVNQVVTATTIQAMMKQSKEEWLQRGYLLSIMNVPDAEVEAHLPYTIKGTHRLSCEIILKYVDQALKRDLERVPFTCLGTEQRYTYTYTTPTGCEVKLKGIIDRIDEKDGIVRLYDYKTTKESSQKQIISTESDIVSLFNTDRNFDTALLQLLFYKKLTQTIFATKKVTCHLYKVRKLFVDEFNSLTEKAIPDNWDDVFTEQLNKSVAQMTDPSYDIQQTTEEKNCEYCKFKDICGK